MVQTEGLVEIRPRVGTFVTSIQFALPNVPLNCTEYDFSESAQNLTVAVPFVCVMESIRAWLAAMGAPTGKLAPMLPPPVPVPRAGDEAASL